ncbi:MAG: ABC transporter ATP-binding protein [Solirubrobacterales bacterium]
MADVSVDIGAGEIVGLLGENGAGKSTLMKVVAGLVAPDAGRVLVDGGATIRSPADARGAGIGMVHQHFMLVPTMTVAENVAMGHGGGSLKQVQRRVNDLSQRYGLEVDPQARVSELSVGERQRAEIVRMLFGEPRILIFDEPTAVLTPREWNELAALMSELAGEGRAILFITHKLDELLAVADRCVVLRDGVVVEVAATAGATKQDLARAMVGREVRLPSVDRRPPGEPYLEVRDLELVDEEGRLRLQDISFEVGRGEILGIAGVDGNGQDELVEVLTGLVPSSSGMIEIGGAAPEPYTPVQFLAAGGAVIHADRHDASVADELSIADNMLLVDAQDSAMSRYGLMRGARARERCRTLMEEFDVRAVGVDALIQQLSGGNQQKVVLARELGRRPQLLIAAQPTRGLDIAAVAFVHDRLLEHRDRGGATVLISTELEEILSISDRIAVMTEGRLVAFLDPRNADPNELGLLMAGAGEAR